MSDGLGFQELLSSFGLDRDRNGVYDVCLTMMNLALWLLFSERNERRV